ncbi:7TM diverse intracellular signaling domain-containing protein [Rhodocytophaga aerolata]|uniref:histidine kinase n=1 Tax=Rhodocytophaga aerolata TaxID=455078 RepID=A0ABT8R9A9_9BACT|nr:7TM diverse intracellular signaling domain-containing protein [Rhodocytophaga aerolata]MDO1448683.1 7TM diverse intracellular signaling domain-containing protein [Rhodocytophaga aerolata]
MTKLLLSFLFLLFTPLLLLASDGLTLGYSDFQASKPIRLASAIEVVSDPKGTLLIDSIIHPAFSSRFISLAKTHIADISPVYWVKFTVRNTSAIAQECKLSVPFADYVHLYYPDNTGAYHMQFSGDMVPLNNRAVKTGKLVFFPIYLPARSVQTFYVRCESRNAIAQQFKSFTLRTLNIYPQPVFEENFGTAHRINQALFFGAMLIMLLYNLFIFSTLKDITYLMYVGYTCMLITFVASNDGFILELFLLNKPHLDLYIRFISTPALIFLYLLFSKSFLKPHQYANRWTRPINGLLWVLPCIMLSMCLGYWHIGRSLAIISAIISFLLILIVSFKSLKEGYTPAKFFLIANILLIAGATLYAIDRFFNTSQNLVIQYGLQLGIICEVAFFSFGLAARINLTQLELKDQILENERLEKEKEIGLKRVIEEKNRELEEKVIERTAEVVHQKEEILTQNELLSLNYQQLEAAQQLIEKQNQALASANTKLEKAVMMRTKELQTANEELLKSNQELDRFIYRTAHDIKGPLARLIGLSHVALLDVQDGLSLSYLEKLNFEANYLNYILSRLSSIYEINHKQLAIKPINVEELIHRTIDQLKFVEGYSQTTLAVEVLQQVNFSSDEYLLTFILQNLLENAIFFQQKTNEVAHQVDILVRKEGSSLLIFVRDNGTGIPSEEAATIFDMFSKAAGKYKTAGMGLYMAQLCAHKLGGTIQLVKSEHGATEFLVKLHLMIRKPTVKKWPSLLEN